MQQQILFKKAWAQAVNLLRTGRAATPAFCMTMFGIFFVSLEKKNPYLHKLLRNTTGGIQPVNWSANACSCPDKRAASRSRGVFQISWAWSSFFWLLCLSLPHRLPSASSQGWCVQRPGSIALWLREGPVFHQQRDLPVATQPSLSSRQFSIISAAHHSIWSQASASFTRTPAVCKPRFSLGVPASPPQHARNHTNAMAFLSSHLQASRYRLLKLSCVLMRIILSIIFFTNVHLHSLYSAGDG